MIAPAKPLATVAVLAMLGGLPAGESRAESAFFTTDPVQLRNGLPGAGESQTGGILGRLREAMGLSPHPSAPMQLVPEMAAPAETAASPATMETYGDIFSPQESDVGVAATDRGSADPVLDDPEAAMLRQPPPKPLVSVVGALDPADDLSSDFSEEPVERIAEPAPAPLPSDPAEPALARLPADPAVAAPVPAIAAVSPPAALRAPIGGAMQPLQGEPDVPAGATVAIGPPPALLQATETTDVARAAGIAVGIPVPAPRRASASGPLLAGSTPPVPALPPRHPRRAAAPGPAADDAAMIVAMGATVADEPAADAAQMSAPTTSPDPELTPGRATHHDTDSLPPEPQDDSLAAGSAEAAAPNGDAHAANTPAPSHEAHAADIAQDATQAGEDMPGPGTSAAHHGDDAHAPASGHDGDVADSNATAQAHGAAPSDEDAATAKGEDEAEALPPPPPSELPKLMRVMSTLQDDIARGSGSALAAQRVMSKRVAEEIAANSDRTLAVPQNARALLHYALTGGSPPDVRAAIDRTAFAPPYDELLPGALAFLEGRQNDARRHFDAVPIDSLSAVTQGPVRLAMAALTLEQDPVKALDHLDWARHSAPGTLVEEAALRRAVLLTAERNMLDRFEALTSRYLRKFRTSAYAGNFRRRLAAALTRMRFLDEPGGFERLAKVLEPMSLEGRREIYLDIARSAVEGGRSTVGATAARLSRESAPSDSLDAARADLYAAAADVVDPGRNEAALAALNTMDVTPLPQGDRALHSAARQLGQAVATLPEPAAPEPVLASLPPDLPPVVAGAPIAPFDPALLQATETAPPAEEPSPIESRVQTTLDEIDALLRKSP